MTTDRSLPDFEEEVLAAFLRELEATGDRAAVVKAYSHRHPALAEELSRLEEMNRLVARTGRDESFGVPQQLGEFRIIRRVAHGGMGDIYEAVQDRLNRRVAVKTIRRGRIAEHVRGRFFREQRVLARLHQTHIVPIHAAGEEGDLLYFVMPYIDGAALSQVVRAATEFGTVGPGTKTPSLARLADRVTTARSSGDAVVEYPDQSTLPQTAAPLATPNPVRRRRVLSGDYFRSVATTLADAADAVDHAHKLNILHRDLKPSNILIDRHGQSWVIDFGLAGFVGRAGGPCESASGDGAEGLTMGGVIGTPQYMAPEQWRGEPADIRTDVWGLGVTLYELLTLRRPFDAPTDADARDRVLEHDPAPPRKIIQNVPTDLAAVCRKALRKDPEQRYQTAEALAGDLRRWLGREPVTARPAWVMRRVALWASRNRGWAAAIAFLLVAVVVVVTLEVHHERRQAVRERADRRMLEFQQLRHGKHANGWRGDALGILRDVHRLVPADSLRDHAAALLTGIDAVRAGTFGAGGSAIAFDGSGGRLMIGGLNDGGGRPRDGARLIDLATGETIAASHHVGVGPVAFRADRPVTLIPRSEDRYTLDLCDQVTQQRLRTFTIADAPQEPVWEETYPALALSTDGSLAVAAALRPGEKPGGRRVLRLWETATGKRVQEWEFGALGLAISPDNLLVAAGDANGDITIWTVADGKGVMVLHSGGRGLDCLAFGRDPWKSSRGGCGWLLAAGDAGSRVTVWDLNDGSPRCRCLGSWYEIKALAFSPDGMTLASGGREVRLWDTATGRPLLEIGGTDHVNGLSFDPDGRRLAIAGAPRPGLDQVEVWDLNKGGGATTLTGLVGPVAKTAFSRDGRYVAALSQQWQIAVWDREAGRLLHILDGPRGDFVDNAALAFDATGSRLACAGGRDALLWKVLTGERIASWRLPTGLQDALAFDPTGRGLWSVRCETKSGVPPYTHANFREHRRVYPVRNLLGPHPTDAVMEIPSSDDHVKIIVMAPDASAVFLNTWRHDEGRGTCTVRAVALPAGTDLWSAAAESGDLTLDPRGEIVGYGKENEGSVIAAARSGETIRTEAGIVGPGGEWWFDGHGRLGVGDVHVAGLNIDDQRALGPQFSPCGRFLAVGRNDGTVIVYKLDAFRKHLAEFANR
jgi:serine/threonine protein kinase/WD40 repeat protein